MAKNPKFNVKLPSEAVRPLYAAAGATDLAVEIARGYVTEAQVKVTDVQKKATQRVSSVDLEPKALQTKAVSVVNARVDELSKEAKARQARVEKAYAELQDQAKAFPAKVEAYLNGTIADLNGTYVELAARGEKLVTRIRRQQATQDAKAAASTTVAKAKSTKTSAGKGASATTTSAKGTATTAKKSAAKSASATKSRAKGTATTAKKAAKAPRSNAKATGTAATKTAAKATEATTAAAQKVGD
jgi:heparin binding hemagglutinin HbhA